MTQKSKTSSPFRPGKSPAETRTGLHPRNRHQGRYDFAQLTKASPELSAFLIRTPRDEVSIDFKNPVAVRALNRALLKLDYGISQWNIPDGYLCPPIPGRADYLHAIADLLAESHGGSIPRGASVRVLDIGVGANCIYPLIGHAEYGWNFVGSDIDPNALNAAETIINANELTHAIELREQTARGKIFNDVLRETDRFDITLCNPPFHTSAEEAARGSERKWKNLGASKHQTSDRASAPPALNFGGKANELWCTGGEASFLRRMIRESVDFKNQIQWFTSLVAKSEHLIDIRKQLHKIGAKEIREIAMAQGSKQSRFVAWTFIESET